MFSILLAGVPIGIDHRYAFVRKQCADYFSSEAPVFTVSAGEKELAEELSKCTEELKNTVPDLMGYCESVCLYRKICLELPRYNAFLFHSAAVKQGDSAYIFSAPSGTGKSTHLRLWMRRFGKELAVINGDKPILRLTQEGTFRVYGTPWAGKEGWQNNISGELRGICFLEQSPQNRIRRLTPEEDSFSQGARTSDRNAEADRPTALLGASVSSFLQHFRRSRRTVFPHPDRHPNLSSFFNKVLFEEEYAL